MRATILPMLGLLALATVSAPPARAEESVGDKARDSAADTKRDVKKGVRKIKQRVRKATGTDSTGKDIKDKVNDVGDDFDAAADKTKRKL